MANFSILHELIFVLLSDIDFPPEGSPFFIAMPPLKRPAAVQKEQTATKAGRMQEEKTDKTENAEQLQNSFGSDRSQGERGEER